MILGIHVTQQSKVLDDKTPYELHLAIRRDLDHYGLNACQLFTYGPRLPIKNSIDYKKLLKETIDIDVSVHSCYPTTSIWKINHDNKSTPQNKKRLTIFKNQLSSTRDIGGWCFVLHINRILPRDAIETLEIIHPLCLESNVKLGIEMVSSKADTERTYETPEKLDNLISQIEKIPTNNKDWYGIVVDTAHLWGAGVDIKSYDSMENWLSRFFHKKKICMVHLNGSSAERGSGKDKHEAPFSPDDKIWHDIPLKKSGLFALVKFCIANQITIICEINRGTQKNISKSLSMIKSIDEL